MFLPGLLVLTLMQYLVWQNRKADEREAVSHRMHVDKECNVRTDVNLERGCEARSHTGSRPAIVLTTNCADICMLFKSLTTGRKWTLAPQKASN
jgi:hypothetical protein